MKQNNFTKVVAYDNYEIITYETGFVQLKTIVNEESLNPYGNAHGGFLFTLCDSLAGEVGMSLNSYCVTQQSSINYMKSATLHDELILTGKCLHNGKHTKVVQVGIHNKEELIAQANFTMYVLNITAH